VQARAHVLLKGKEAELKAARLAVAASPDQAARLLEVQNLATVATQERLQARLPSSLANGCYS
jgi:hypothetical protein